MYVCMYVSSPEGGDEQRHTYPDRKVPRDKTTFGDGDDVSSGARAPSQRAKASVWNVVVGCNWEPFPCDRSSTTFGIDSVKGRSSVTDV